MLPYHYNTNVVLYINVLYNMLNNVIGLCSNESCF